VPGIGFELRGGYFVVTRADRNYVERSVVARLLIGHQDYRTSCLMKRGILFKHGFPCVVHVLRSDFRSLDQWCKSGRTTFRAFTLPESAERRLSASHCRRNFMVNIFDRV
jgi:hypothetical protein